MAKHLGVSEECITAISKEEYEKQTDKPRKDAAYLIMDMPENCYDCKMAGQLMNERVCRVNSSRVQQKGSGKPDWCPLRELPEKMKTDRHQACYANSYWTDEMKAGFNACLDEIIRQLN